MDESQESESTRPEPDSAPEAPEPAPPARREHAAVVPVGRREEIDAICGRIDSAPSLAVVLHAPNGNRAMASELGMRRVVRHVEASGRVLAVATRSGALARRARAQGVPVSWNPYKVHWGSGGKVVFRLGPLALLVPPFGRYAQYVALALFVLAVAAALFTAGPSVTVTAYPRTQTVEGLAVVRASARIEEIDFERLLLPATVVTVERSTLLAIPTTGEIVRGTAAATATLSISNPTDAAITVPARSVVYALPAFIAFEFDEAVTVPAGGSTFAALTARAPGIGGNVAADTITEWQESALSALTATNPDPASGGTDEVVRAVATADIVALETLAADIGGSQPPASLLTDEYPAHAIVLRSATITITLGEPSAPVGQTADAVFMEVAATIQALAVAPETLELLASSLLSAPGDTSELIPGAVRASETGNLQVDHPDGSFTGEIAVSAEFSRGPSVAEIEEAVSGRSPAAAEAELRTRYGMGDVEIDLIPGWAPRLPRFGFRIDVHFASRTFDPQPADPQPAETDADPGASDGP